MWIEDAAGLPLKAVHHFSGAPMMKSMTCTILFGRTPAGHWVPLSAAVDAAAQGPTARPDPYSDNKLARAVYNGTGSKPTFVHRLIHSYRSQSVSPTLAAQESILRFAHAGEQCFRNRLADLCTKPSFARFRAKISIAVPAMLPSSTIVKNRPKRPFDMSPNGSVPKIHTGKIHAVRVCRDD